MALPEFPLEVPNHAGQPNDPADVFFGELDALGPILSAQTNLNSRRGRRLWTRARLGMAFVGLILGGLAGLLVAVATKGDRFSVDDPVLASLVGGGALLGFLFFAWLGRPWDVCTLVAKRGLALVRRRGMKQLQKTLLFEQAAQLRQQQTRMYYNGIYVGTQYLFDWLDSQGKRLFRIRGNYRERR